VESATITCKLQGKGLLRTFSNIFLALIYLLTAARQVKGVDTAIIAIPQPRTFMSQGGVRITMFKAGELHGGKVAILPKTMQELLAVCITFLSQIHSF